MDRSDAYRRLADVVNLQDDVADARRVVEGVEDKIAKANERLDQASASGVKAAEALDAAEARLAEAQSLAAEIPADLITEVARQIGSQRATRARYLEALASDDGGDEHHIAVREAAEAAGATVAHAGTAEGFAEGNGV